MAASMTTRAKTPAPAEGTAPKTEAMARDAVDTVKTTAEEAAARLPAVATTARDAIAEAGRTIRTESDDRLAGGALLTFGLALGLLVGGANRLLVIAALIPTTAMGITLLDRGRRLQGRR